MKQKVMIKVSMNCQKCRSKALQIAVGASSGVESVGLKGVDKNQIEVIGDGIDAAKLTKLLRKKLGHADLESVSAATSGGGTKPVENKGKENVDKIEVVWPTYIAAPPFYHDACLVVRDPSYDECCFIM